jgi:hypothetical protein
VRRTEALRFSEGRVHVCNRSEQQPVTGFVERRLEFAIDLKFNVKHNVSREMPRRPEHPAADPCTPA